MRSARRRLVAFCALGHLTYDGDRASVGPGRIAFLQHAKIFVLFSAVSLRLLKFRTKYLVTLVIDETERLQLNTISI